jgi:hypothetical protein
MLIARLVAAGGGSNAEVKMIHAEAKVFYHETFIAWSTEFEGSQGEFMIEASENGKDWFIRGKQRSHGAANRQADYQFVDKREDRFTRYRIRLLDNRGKNTVLAEFTPDNYSVTVKIEEQYIERERKLLLEYSIDKDQELLVRIYNRIGEQVYTKILPTKTAGEYIYQLDIGHLKADNYLLVVTQVLLDKAVAEKAFQIKK